MATPSAQPAAASPKVAALKLKQARADQEFLPAALEILEAPPSPVRMALIMIICAFACAALAWSWFGHTDIFAVASGKFQPAGQIKVVQPLEPGRIQAVNVRNGQHVAAGETVALLDASEATSVVAGLSTAFESYRAEAVRRQFALALAGGRSAGELAAAAQRVAGGADLPSFPDGISVALQSRETAVLRDDMGALAASIGSLVAQKAQKQAARDGLAATMEAERALIATLKARVEIHGKLMAENAGTRTAVLDATETLQVQQTTLATQASQLADATTNLAVLDAEMLKIRESFRSDYSQKLADAARRADDLEQQLAKAQAQLDRLVLKSPVAGTVQDMSVTTVGQVVQAGQQLMRITPDNSQLEVVAYIENKDIGFVHDGQDVVLKVESFPFTRYGTVPGRVVHVARDSVPSTDALRSEGDPTQAPKDQGYFASQTPTQSLVYALTIQPLRTFIHAGDEDVALSPGMTVSAEIRTGSRRILEYLLSPLAETTASAMGER